jgi:hypothetical protein
LYEGELTWDCRREGCQEEEGFEVEGRCELYVGIYVNQLVEATAR